MNVFMVSNLLGGSGASGSGGIYGVHANSASLEYEISSIEELSLCKKSQFSNTYISTTKLWKPLIFQTLIVWYNRSHSLKHHWIVKI